MNTDLIVVCCCYAAFGILIAFWYVGRVRQSLWAKSLRTRLASLEVEKRLKPLNPNLRRLLNNSLTELSSSVRKEHPHAAAAGGRNAATEIMIAAVRKCGLEPFVLSPSPREHGLDHVRNFYVITDLNQTSWMDEITDEHVIIMTDVDYYVDMHEILSYGRPVLAYTFHPERVSGSTADGFYTISNQQVTYTVSGGRQWKHQVWNYNDDAVYVNGSIIGFRDALWKSVSHVACSIDQFAAGDSRRIVSLVPFAELSADISFSSLWYRTQLWLLGLEPIAMAQFGNTLTRMKYGTKSGVNRIVYMDGPVPMVSLGFEGGVAHVELPLERYENLVTAHQLSTSRHLSDTVRRSKLDPDVAALLHACLERDCKVNHQQVVHTPGKLAKHYIVLNETAYNHPYSDGKKYARKYASPPLSEEASYPCEGIINTHACLEDRIEKPQRLANAKLRRVEYTQRPVLLRWAGEFVSRVVTKRSGKPISIDEVVQKQNRPTQRVRSLQAKCHAFSKFIVRAFQKREAYSAPSAPRNISTVPVLHTLKLSSFTYAFKEDNLLDKGWYVPCCTPKEIAEKIRRLASENEAIVETDYSRFDGTINEWLRKNIEFACYLRWVDAPFRTELHTLLESELNPTAISDGVRYDPGCSRLSGSPLTTDGNSLINAFASYCINRKIKMTPDESFAAIGLVYGDDGLRPGGATDALIVKTGDSLGLTCKVLKRASAGDSVSFLSRVFHDPWTTSSSFQQPMRAMMKIHTTCDTLTDIHLMGRLKSEAYLTTDGNTPLISDWCTAYLKNAGDVKGVAETTDIPWWCRDDAFLDQPWPQDSHNTMVPHVANCLGVSSAELLDHCALLAGYSGDVMDMPKLTIERGKPNITAVVDGEIHVLEPTLNPEGEVSTNPVIQTLNHGGCNQRDVGETSQRATSRGAHALRNNTSNPRQRGSERQDSERTRRSTGPFRGKSAAGFNNQSAVRRERGAQSVATRTRPTRASGAQGLSPRVSN